MPMYLSFCFSFSTSVSSLFFRSLYLPLSFLPSPPSFLLSCLSYLFHAFLTSVFLLYFILLYAVLLFFFTSCLLLICFFVYYLKSLRRCPYTSTETDVAIIWLALLFRIRKIPASNVDLETDCPD
jgi:hypothetical protein